MDVSGIGLEFLPSVFVCAVSPLSVLSRFPSAFSRAHARDRAHARASNSGQEVPNWYFFGFVRLEKAAFAA